MNKRQLYSGSELRKIGLKSELIDNKSIGVPDYLMRTTQSIPRMNQLLPLSKTISKNDQTNELDSSKSPTRLVKFIKVDSKSEMETTEKKSQQTF